MRRPVYILPDRPWWVDLARSFVEAAICGVAFLVVLFLVGCGDDVECPPADAGADIRPFFRVDAAAGPVGLRWPITDAGAGGAGGSP